MKGDKKQFYLYIDGRAIPVSEEVYYTYWHYANKEDYFMRGLKAERRVLDRKTNRPVYLPSREVSLEQMVGEAHQFPTHTQPVEDAVLAKLWLEELLPFLTEEEREIVRQLYDLDRSEREACAALSLAKTTFRRRKEALQAKLRQLMEEND